MKRIRCAKMMGIGEGQPISRLHRQVPHAQLLRFTVICYAGENLLLGNTANKVLDTCAKQPQYSAMAILGGERSS